MIMPRMGEHFNLTHEKRIAAIAFPFCFLAPLFFQSFSSLILSLSFFLSFFLFSLPLFLCEITMILSALQIQLPRDSGHSCGLWAFVHTQHFASEQRREQQCSLPSPPPLPPLPAPPMPPLPLPPWASTRAWHSIA